MFVQTIHCNVLSCMEEAPIGFLHWRIVAFFKTKYPDLDEMRLQFREIRSIVWNDGSLGCPIPGLAYTQALVPGYCIEYVYPDWDLLLEVHADGGLNTFAMPGLGFVPI